MAAFQSAKFSALVQIMPKRSLSQSALVTSLLASESVLKQKAPSLPASPQNSASLISIDWQELRPKADKLSKAIAHSLFSFFDTSRIDLRLAKLIF